MMPAPGLELTSSATLALPGKCSGRCALDQEAGRRLAGSPISIWPQLPSQLLDSDWRLSNASLPL